MALFHFGEKKEENKVCTCACNADGNPKDTEFTPIIGSYSIKVLGAGCKTCHQQYQNVLEAVKNLDIQSQVEYITDMEKVMEYGVMVMPAILVNEKVAASGKLLSVKDVEKMLKG